ncbi:MAG TPA: SPOR domain-containing protein [Candidatus Acidoferrales bacterium]|nr:SPOR domain-containing protein [Candidatus Acidoferrales bacterium]
MAELGTGRVKSSLLDDLDETRDTEITLGTGKLLGIFFALTILCAVFFTMGYLLGKSTVAGGRTEIVGTVPSSGSAAGKPSAVNKAPETPPPAPSPDASSQQQPATPAAATSSTSSSGTQQSTVPVATDIKSNVNGTYTVQVAAVSKQEDADILATALRKKQYPVFIASATGDALFHVQVGPFSTQQDADTMRNRLSADGYNAIVKH